MIRVDYNRFVSSDSWLLLSIAVDYMSLCTNKMHCLSKNTIVIATVTCFSTPLPSSGGVLSHVMFRNQSSQWNIFTIMLGL